MTLPPISSMTPGPLEAGDPTYPTLVLLHGLGMGAWMWRPQLPALAAHYHTLAPDLPGCGSAKASGPFTMERAAQAVVDLVRANGGRPAHLCGLSLGAMVALQVYQSAPEVVASLILSGGQVHPHRQGTRARWVMVSLLPARTMTGAVLGDLPEPVRQRSPELVADALASARQTSKRSLLRALRAVAAVDFRGLLPTILVPTLVLCGAKDAPNLPAARQMGATIPQAELQIIPGVGHFWNLEQPDLFAQTVLTFAQRVDAQHGEGVQSHG
jgi:3-oxoadipate enol-lactonase